MIPDEIIPNVEFLGPLVEDIQLVLFETDEFGSNLPDPAYIRRLNDLAENHGLTYTVHLPLDLRLGNDGSQGRLSLVKARRVIHATCGLDPFAYTVHLDGTCLLGAPPPEVVTGWLEESRRALALTCEWLDEPARLSIENVEGWDPEIFAPLLSALPVSRTIDVGHLWLRGVDPMPHLTRWIDRARVVHLHGIGERDHSSLDLVSEDILDPVVELLMESFSGVVTLEVFDLAGLRSSLTALTSSMTRVAGGVCWEPS